MGCFDTLSSRNFLKAWNLSYEWSVDFQVLEDIFGFLPQNQYLCQRGPSAKKGKAKGGEQSTAMEWSQILRLVLLASFLQTSNGAPVDDEEKKFALVRTKLNISKKKRQAKTRFPSEYV